MNGYWSLLPLVAIPVAAQLAGGWLAEPWDISEWILDLALHAAAGIVLSIVAVDLIPEALKVDRSWVVVLCFFAGGLFFMGLDKVTDLVSDLAAGSSGGSSAWLLYAGIMVDLISDGVLLGASATISHKLLLLLALGQAAGDLPQGFTAIASLRRHEVPRLQRILLTAGFALPLFAGATVGFFGVRGGSELLKKAIVAFTAGFLATLVVEEIVPQAHEGENARVATGVFVAGFAFYMWLSSALS